MSGERSWKDEVEDWRGGAVETLTCSPLPASSASPIAWSPPHLLATAPCFNVHSHHSFAPSSAISPASFSTRPMSTHHRLDAPLYSSTLHILVLRARTSCVTSFTILAFCLDGSVWNHLARRTLPGCERAASGASLRFGELRGAAR